MEDDWGFAADSIHVGLNNMQRQTCGDCCVERISAG
jgi:hypothetical protein